VATRTAQCFHDRFNYLKNKAMLVIVSKVASTVYSTNLTLQERRFVMAIPNVSTSSQAVANYAAQLQAIQPRNRTQESETKTPEQEEKPQGGDRVTLSTQSAQGASQTAELQTNRNNEAERAANTQSVERKQLNNPEETRSAASKSVTQALEAYVQTSLI
jgi:hypothetical protein